MNKLCALLLVSALLVVAAAAAVSPYDQECNKMIKAAKTAATKFNKGDKQGAEAQIAKVRAAFSKAKKMDPKHPQAYLNFAIFCSNTHRYDESIEAFETAQQLLGDTNPQATQQIQQSMAKAKYEMYSMHRDKTYENGNGNLFEAHEWAEKQATVTREPHKIKHELATMEVMMCDVDEAFCDKAMTNFQGASVSSFQQYVYTHAPENPAKREECLRSKLHVGTWEHHGAIEAREVEPGLYVNTVNTVVTLQGRDGIMTIEDNGDCSVFSPASDFFPNIADNLNPKRPFEEGYIADVKVLNLVKFSGTAFYHWLCEVVPALVVAKQTLTAEEFEDLKVLVPSVKEQQLPAFINQTLTDLFKEWPGLADRIIPFTPNVKLTTGSVAVTWKEQRCPGAAEDDNSKQAYGCAALTHPAALVAARTEIHASLGPLDVPWANKGTEQAQDPGDAYILMAMRGEDVSMRKLNEGSLYKKLANLASSAGGLRKSFTVRSFVSNDYNFTEGLQLFRGAAIVVGAHGGALSNIIACEKHSHLIEIGFRTKAAQHYRHIAESLGMFHKNINVAPDTEFGRGLGASDIDVDEQVVLTEVYNAMKQVDKMAGRRHEAIRDDEL